jgi:D-aminopeptidase
VPPAIDLRMVCNERMTPIFDAVVEATEEAIVNALLAAETLTGRDGVTAHALPARRLAELVENRGFAATS